jgi:glutathione S-transferase
MLCGVPRIRLFVVHGSHPCAAVEKAMQMKGLPYKVVEWPPPLHAPLQRMLFGARTVPAIRLEGGEKLSGSRAIMRRLEQLAPAPALLPEDPAQRARVEEAERWGDEVFQPLARQLIWAAMVRRPDAIVSYSEHSRLPMPAPLLKASAPAIARVAARLNRTNGSVAARVLSELPAHLDRIDGWLADGTLGDVEHPNVADLQIASTVRLMLTIADARALIAGRPCETWARSLFPRADGEMPAGAIAAPA